MVLFDAPKNPRSIRAKIQGLPNRVLIRWLLLLRTHVVWVHLGAALILLIISQIILWALKLQHSIPQTIAIEVGIVLTSFLVPPALTLLSLWREIRRIIELISIGPPVATKVVLQLIGRELSEHVESLEALHSAGMPIVTETVPAWVRTRCWEYLDGKYIGTDSNVPSKFNAIYRDYLHGHRGYINRTGRQDSCRIIFASRDALEKDRERNPEAFAHFLAWHKTNHVQLLLLDPKRIMQLADYYKTGGVTDMGAWEGELILLWRYHHGGSRVSLNIAWIGEDLYERCLKFLHATKEEAKPFPP
jgi:hypothetical protein